MQVEVTAFVIEAILKRELSSTGSFCFFVGNVKSAKKMTPIGKFTDDENVLKNVKPGDVIRLYEDTT